MDKRMLRELELLGVAKIYGYGDTDGSQATGDRSQVKAEAGLPPDTSDLIPSMSWQDLRASVAACARCGLCKARKQAVFGVGSESAAWLFVGEGPGADEDEQGEPFVGQAGKLLDSMMAAVGIRRGREAYIANVVKCRPPGNRTPTLEEAQACAPFLDRQVDLIAPRLIVALGKTAAMRLLNTEASLGSLRGQVHRYRGTPLVVTYHPAYLLRNLPDKAKAWEDLLFARRTLRRIEQGASA